MQETIIIRYLEEDKQLHTEDHPFCPDWECPCHANVEAINTVTSQLMDGLLSWAEAQSILRGGRVC